MGSLFRSIKQKLSWIRKQIICIGCVFFGVINVSSSTWQIHIQRQFPVLGKFNRATQAHTWLLLYCIKWQLQTSPPPSWSHQGKLILRTVCHWSEVAIIKLQACFDSTNWLMFCDAANVDINEYTNSVTVYIAKCMEGVVPKITVQFISQQNSPKLMLMSMPNLYQCCIQTPGLQAGKIWPVKIHKTC